MQGKLVCMRFVRLSAEAYASFVHKQSRLFLPQMPEYGITRVEQGFSVEYLGVVEGDSHASERIMGAGLLTIQPWKKAFQRALMNYGPTLDWSNSQLVTTFFTGLTDFLRMHYPRALAVQISPLVPKNRYADIEVIEECEVGAQADHHLRELGYARINKEFYEQSDIQIRYIYTKSIASMSFEEATATLSKGLRRRFHNEGRYGVEVRFLGPDEFGVFEQLHESAAERTEMAGITSSSESLYRSLMEKLGSQRAFLCVAFYSPKRYIQQIEDEQETVRARIATVEARKPTKARDRDLHQAEERLRTLESNHESALESLDEFGDRDIPFNSALSFISGDELILLLGGMDKRFASYGRDYPVERAMFKLACDKGLSVYNTFGITGCFDETAIDAPVLSFKRWLNGNVEEFIGTYNRPLHPKLARALGATE